MNALLVADLEAASERWRDALRTGLAVQYWDEFEKEAAELFGVHSLEHNEVMHSVMQFVVAVCQGGAAAVKMQLRSMGPAGLALCTQLFDHIPQFSVVLSAETNFRRGLLVADWKVVSDPSLPGRSVVRSEFRNPSKESKH